MWLKSSQRNLVSGQYSLIMPLFHMIYIYIYIYNIYIHILHVTFRAISQYLNIFNVVWFQLSLSDWTLFYWGNIAIFFISIQFICQCHKSTSSYKICTTSSKHPHILRPGNLTLWINSPIPPKEKICKKKAHVTKAGLRFDGSVWIINACVRKSTRPLAL